MLNHMKFHRDLSELLSSPVYAGIVNGYERGMITLEEAVREIARRNEKSRKEAAARLRRENREARKAEPKKFLNI